MKIEIDDGVISEMQGHIPCRMSHADTEFIAKCIFDIGLIAVNSALEKHPHLTFGQLLTAYFGTPNDPYSLTLALIHIPWFARGSEAATPGRKLDQQERLWVSSQI